jgi:hypothetical protein
MAGRGPAPGANPNRKDATQRRRRNVDPSFDELPAEGYSGPFPPLAAAYSNRGRRVRFLKATREWYATWARSPMATRFTGTDWQRLRLLAPLVDQANREPSTRLMAEIRLQESGLGATILDRQRLRMRVGVSAPPAESEPESGLPNVRRIRAVRAV